MAENDLMQTVDSLIDSIDDVEEALEPLLSKSLQDSLDSADGPIERAKILFWLAYAIHSCTWAFTKTAAVDAEEHGVMDELARIKEYNSKIVAAVKRAENKTDGPESSQNVASEGEKRRMPLDKEAASRFIKAGIANQSSKPSSSSTFYSAEATVSDPLAGPGPHTRLSSLARVSTPVEDGSSQHASSSNSSDGEEELKVFTSMVPGTSGSNVDDIETDKTSTNESPSETTEIADAKAEEDKKKRRQEKKRKRLLGVNNDGETPRKITTDPLQGYDKDVATVGQSKKGKVQAEQNGNSRARSVMSSVQTDSSAGTGPPSGEKKKRRKHKQESAL